MTTIRMLEDGDGYRPGACNIGPAEIARRRRSGITGLLAAAGLAGVLVVVDAAPLLRLLVGVPLFLGILGLLQARLRFCVAFGIAGVHRFGRSGSTRHVGDRAARGANLRRAAVLTLVAGAAAGVLAVGFALLPL